MASIETTTELNLITMAEAARVLRVAPRTIVRMIETGQLEQVAQSDTGFRFFDGAAVEALRLEREANPPRRGRPKKSVATETA